MARIGFVSFAATTCVLVPTALHVLDAGPKQVAKLLAPDAHTLHLGAATVEVKADSAIVDPGGKVHVTLTATSATTERVSLDVLVMEAQGTGGDRVETPAVEIARRHVGLQVKPGAPATKDLAFVIPGVRGYTMGGIMPFGHYTVLVMPPQAADKLERMRRKAAAVENAMMDKTGDFGRFEQTFYGIGEDRTEDPADDRLGVAGKAARLEIRTRPNGPVTILAKDGAEVGETFPVVVRVTSSTKARNEVTVSLSTKPSMLGDAYLGLAEEQVTIQAPEQTKIALAPGEIRNVVFRVTAKAKGVLGLYAETRADDDESGGSLNDVALDAVEIGGAAVVGSR